MTREISDLIIALFGAFMIFVAMPWLFLHYNARQRRQEEINEANQKLIEELGERSRRLDERAAALEQIVGPEGADPLGPPQRADRRSDEPRRRSIEDLDARLAELERKVTDPSARTAREIDKLR